MLSMQRVVIVGTEVNVLEVLLGGPLILLFCSMLGANVAEPHHFA
jgi:hypothetical protein